MSLAFTRPPFPTFRHQLHTKVFFLANCAIAFFATTFDPRFFFSPLSVFGLNNYTPTFGLGSLLDPPKVDAKANFFFFPPFLFLLTFLRATGPKKLDASCPSFFLTAASLVFPTESHSVLFSFGATRPSCVGVSSPFNFLTSPAPPTPGFLLHPFWTSVVQTLMDETDGFWLTVSPFSPFLSPQITEDETF